MPKTRTNTGKILGWVALSVVLLVFVLVVAAWFVFPIYVKNNLSDYVSEKSNGLYQLEYENIDFKWLPFSLHINAFNLKPDKQIAKKVLSGSPEKIVYSFQASEIGLTGIQLKKLIRKSIFHANGLTIIDPELELFGDKILQKDSTKKIDNVFYELQPLFQKSLKKISIDKIEFINAKYGLSQAIGEAQQFSKAEQISVDILKFRTDSALIFNSNNFFETDDILVRMNNFKNVLSDSLHTVNIDTLQYSLKTSEIAASGFHIKPDNWLAKKNLYNVYVPHLNLISKNIVNLNFNDSLNIRFLEFEHAEIKFFQKENPQKIKIQDISDFDLYKLVENDFLKIEVDTFLLSDASLQIFSQPNITDYQQSFNRLNIKLNGFLLDSASARNKNKLLHANDLEMLVAGYHLRLEDNQHEFKADSLFVSTFSNLLGAKQIKVSHVENEQNKSRTEVNITSKSLEIENVNLKDLYHTRQLPTSKIEVLEPRVNLIYNQELKKQKKQQSNGLLFDLVSAYLKGVYANVVFINNGTLNIKNLHQNKLQGYFEAHFTFGLTDFSLDSLSLQRTDKFFYATGFDLRFSDYEMKLVDDLHKLKVDSIAISSINQNVEIRNLHLQPVISDVTEEQMNQFGRSELYNVFVPKINLYQIDLRNAFFNNKVRMKKFRISNPKIYFENFGTLRTGKGKKELSEFYQLIFNYISDFDVENISVPSGEITWVNHTRKDKTISFDNEFSATLYNFKLNENQLNKKRLLFSDNFDISVKDQLFQLSDSVHILRAGEINLSTSKSAIGIKNAVLYPVITSEKYKGLKTTFQVSIPDLAIRNINFERAWYTRNLNLAKLTINNAKFQVYTQPESFKSLELKKFNFPLPAGVNSLEVGELQVNNGEVMTFETKGIQHKAISNFKIDISIPDLVLKNNPNKEAELKTSNLKLTISDFYSPLGKTHYINTGKIIFNKQQQTLFVKSLKINPFESLKKGNRFYINAPEINFTGFDFNEALDNNNFIFDEISILKPQLNVEMNDSVRDDKLDFLQTMDLYPYTEPYVDRISVNNLMLNGAKIKFNWFQKQLIDKEINFSFSDILIAKNQPASNLLNSSEFEISTTNLRTTSKNNLYEFTAEALIYNSAKHNILLKTLAVKPLLEKSEFPKIKGFQTDVITATVDFAELQQIDEKRWLKDNVLDARLLKIGPAKLEFFRNKRYPFNHSQRPQWPQDIIRSIKQPFVFDSVALMPTYLKYSELTPVAETPGFIGFHELQFTAGQLSNIKSEINRFKHFKINASTKFYNRAKLSANFDFDLLSTDYYHTVSGSLSDMPMLPFNNIIEKSAPVIIESGNINRFDFDMVLRKNESEGVLYFGYENFKISLLDYSNEEVKRSKWASFWANKLILNTDTKNGDKLEPVSLLYERDPERSIINYWWKTLFSGAQKKLGIEPKK